MSSAGTLFTRIFQRVRAPLTFAVIMAVFAVILAIWAALFSPTLPEEKPVFDKTEAAEAQRLRAVDSAEVEATVVYQEVDYTEGPEASWYPKGESPLLADLVEEGLLPPVAERVGPEPVVLRGVEGIGQYGGSWTRSIPNPADLSVIGNRLAGSTLVRWSPMGRPIVPHLAKGWERSDDAREWTFFLRQGVRWSDGHPLTTEDFLYYWNEDLQALGLGDDTWMQARGEYGTIEAVDDHTLKFTFPHPNPLFLETIARQNAIVTPRHYLEPFHPEIGDDNLIQQTMEEYGLPSRRSTYTYIRSTTYPAYPRLTPWIFKEVPKDPPFTAVRNPYYWVVDEEGNQLPYIDRLFFEQHRAELLPIIAASGGLGMQARFIRFDDYTILMANREDGGYSVKHWIPSTRSVWTLFPNINRRIDPADPSTAQKHALLNEKQFRQALSLAIDRQSIIDSTYKGIGQPGQLSPGPRSEFHSEKLMNSYVAFDPERANRLLDDLGLDQRDIEGYRTFPDGSTMTWFIEFTDFSGQGPAQFILDDWRRIGVRAIIRERARRLFYSRKVGLLHDFTVWTGESEFDPLVEPRSFVPIERESHHAIAYGIWFQNGGLFGADDLPAAAEAPPLDSPVRRVMELLVTAQETVDPTERRAALEEIFEINAENVWTISISTPPPTLVIVRDDFRNVPDRALDGFAYSTPANTGIETYYIDGAQNSPALTATLQEQFRRSAEGLLAGSVRDGELVLEEGGSLLGQIVLFLILGSLALALLLVAAKHPYIARRLLWMIPTVGVIAVGSFVIIQLPPGSYIEALIIERQTTGDEASLQEIEELTELFHLDKSVFEQFTHWMGLNWFLTFEAEDRGLLQGNLGRSMQSRRSVNDMMGDRLILTVLISMGTILFTWIVALPIGIYSAVRQYSVLDYVFTFVGFIGLCIPNFMLALVLMYVSKEFFGVSVAGLFSPEYATEPSWSWGKFVDLLKHLWVPVVVLGTAGTAGMIRVMRGNLLDELKKPYVTTARAKGVKPMKLLLKYPVRLALNPFISGIGGLFPRLVSGGAIVAIVLSLPTIGPFMLNALLNEDMYLAGSLLIVLSVLGVFGTLVSDLLLLVLDPRIRFQGGSK